MKLYAKTMMGLAVDEGVAKKKEEGIFLRVHSFRDARGALETPAALGDGDIARELHDNVTQQLTAMALLLGKLKQSLIGRNAFRGDEMFCIEEQLLRVTQDVRSLSCRAKASPITAAGFNNAIRALAESVRKSTSLHTLLILAEAPLPDDETAEHLYRIVQEAVHNVIKHAKASCLRVIFKVEGHSFVLVVRDDGNGTFSGAWAPTGMGVDDMTSRAKAIGAQLEVRSIPGRGTAVRCVLPFNRRQTGCGRLYHDVQGRNKVDTGVRN